MRYIAAVAMSPERQGQLKTVLTNMQTIEEALMKSQEIAKHGDAAGAWETVEQVYKQFPEDNKLNQAVAERTTKAADFVRTPANRRGHGTKGPVRFEHGVVSEGATKSIRRAITRPRRWIGWSNRCCRRVDP